MKDEQRIMEEAAERERQRMAAKARLVLPRPARIAPVLPPAARAWIERRRAEAFKPPEPRPDAPCGTSHWPRRRMP